MVTKFQELENLILWKRLNSCANLFLSFNIHSCFSDFKLFLHYYFDINLQIYFPFTIFRNIPYPISLLPFLAKRSKLVQKKLYLDTSCIINTCVTSTIVASLFHILASCLIWSKKSYLMIHLYQISNMFSAVRKFPLPPPPHTHTLFFKIYVCLYCLLN